MDLKEYFDKNDVFNFENGLRLKEVSPGYAVFEVELTEKHLSHVGRTHAHPAVLYSLAETASAAAVLSYGYDCYGVVGEITYTGFAESGTLRAEAKCKDLHEQETVDIRVRIYDEMDNMIAKAKFTSAYTGKPFIM
jgi:uncharacterized protein (TIGR00369 family)